MGINLLNDINVTGSISVTDNVTLDSDKKVNFGASTNIEGATSGSKMILSTLDDFLFRFNGTTKVSFESNGAVNFIGYGGGSITGTGTKALQVTSGGKIIEADITSGTVTGTGSANRVAKFTAAGTIGNSTITDDGTNVSMTGDLTIAGGDLILNSGYKVLSNSAAASTLSIGDVDGGDNIELIKFITYGSNQMSIDDDLITVGAAEFSIGSTTEVTLGTDSHIIYSHSGSSTGLANGNVIKLGSSTTTAGLVYYLSSSTTWATAANTSGNSTKMLGVATGTSSSSGMLLQGVFTKATHGFTIGAPLYISSSGGSLTTTVPTASNSYARVVGYAVDTNNIYFCPDNTWVQNK